MSYIALWLGSPWWKLCVSYFLKFWTIFVKIFSNNIYVDMAWQKVEIYQKKKIIFGFQPIDLPEVIDWPLNDNTDFRKIFTQIIRKDISKVSNKVDYNENKWLKLLLKMFEEKFLRWRSGSDRIATVWCGSFYIFVIFWML